MLLAACAPAEELPSNPVEETSPPDESSPTPTDLDTAYPASEDETDIYIPVASSGDAYPAPPDEPIAPPEIGGNPYPGAPSLDDSPMNIKPEDIVKFEDTTPRSEDKSLTTGAVYIENVEAITQVDETNQENDLITGPGLLLAGYLPTPCNQLRLAVSEPDKDGKIEIAAYTVSDPDVMCIQVLQPFATFVPMKDLPAGQYTISINENEQTVEMTMPE
jgi:hypothetical protein